MAPVPLSVNGFFTLLRQSVEAAGEALGADHALVPLEPWVTDGDNEGVAGSMTLTGRAHLVVTAAGRQVPALRAPVYPLQPQGLVVGRTNKSNLRVDQPTVSRLHAEFSYERGVFTIADRGSYNGTMVNHHVLEPNEAIALRDGDVVVFGEAQTVFGSLAHLAQLIKTRRSSRAG